MEDVTKLFKIGDVTDWVYSELSETIPTSDGAVDSKFSRLLRTFENVTIEKIESMIASRVTNLTSILTMSGIGSEVNEILQSKEASPFGELLTFITDICCEFKKKLNGNAISLF